MNELRLLYIHMQKLYPYLHDKTYRVIYERLKCKALRIMQNG